MMTSDQKIVRVSLGEPVGVCFKPLVMTAVDTRFKIMS